jgi:glucose-1-phosphate cytidylyltransferase
MIEDDGHILEFKEKPQIGEGWINGGFFVFDYRVFDYITDESTILEREPLENLTQDNELVAYRHEGFWHCMDTIRDRDSLNEIWASGKAPWKNW